MIDVRIEFKIPRYYDLYMTCHAHGWINLAPFRWDEVGQKVCFAALVDNVPVDVEAWQEGEKLIAILRSHTALQPETVTHAKGLISRALDLDCDTTGLLDIAERIGPEYATIIKNGAGRLLHAPTLWEDAAKTLFTTNCTWGLTQKMCSALCTGQFSKPAPSGVFPFPLPEVIAGYSPEDLKRNIPVGYRAAYLKALADRFCQDPSLGRIETGACTFKQADQQVRSLKGFGDYAVAHLLILCGFFGEIPIDTVVLSYLKAHYRFRKPKAFIDRTYKKWRPYKWWGLKLEKMIKKQNWIGD